jgi:hypothetical protein
MIITARLRATPITAILSIDLDIDFFVSLSRIRRRAMKNSRFKINK